MTDAERTAVLDEAIRVLVLMKEEPQDDECDRELREYRDTLLGAACFRILLLTPAYAHLRKELGEDKKRPRVERSEGTSVSKGAGLGKDGPVGR